MSEHDDRKIDLASVFPAKGDSRRPPDWWGRALLYTGIAIFIGVYVWQSWSKVSFLVLDIVISIFIALGIEPLVIRMVRHGWKRGVAAAISLLGLAVVVSALLVLFGNMFVQQMVSMVKGLPDIYQQISDGVEQSFNFKLPEINNLGGTIFNNLQTSWVTDFAGQALTTTLGAFEFLLNFLTVMMVTYYVSAAGPKMRRSLCKWLGPNTQRRFLFTWTVVQNQVSGFLFSRSILAAINAVCVAVFMEIIHVPYWLPLALFCGITSQFIPTVGTYIGGALPVLFAWGSNGLGYAVAILVYIVVYQQIENLILVPMISERTMDLNPAIAFLCVLLFGALFGALGAFLALPITASLQAIFKTYMRSYKLVDSPLMSDPTTEKKSKVVAGAEAISEHVIKPVSEHIAPRAVKGSTARVPINDDLRRLQEEIYHVSEMEDGDSQTVAIPKGVLSSRAGRKPSGESLGGGKADGDESGEVSAEVSDDAARARRDPAAEERRENPKREDGQASDNPRSGWR